MIKLFWIRIKSDIWELMEYIQVVFFYYHYKKFAQIDWYLIRSYFSESPHVISKTFMKNKGESNIYVYGETPLTTMDYIAKECGIKESDIVYELGCGRGRACFWLNAFIGCSVYGVEFIPSFVRIAQSVKKRYRIHDVKFLCRDMMDVNLKDATVVYFYGTCMNDEALIGLCKNLAHLPQNSKIITISFPLSNYSAAFKTIKTFLVKFPWGETSAYLQRTVQN